MKFTHGLMLVAGLACALALAGCDKKPQPTSTGKASTGTAPKPDDHTHGDDHGHGATTALGEQVAGGFTIKASRDGDITPGSDAPIDLWVTGAAKVGAVRIWIGTEDAKGSVKAKAELEKDNWHTHVDVPKPLPEGAKLWVEVENDKGEPARASFDLKA